MSVQSSPLSMMLAAAGLLPAGTVLREPVSGSVLPALQQVWKLWSRDARGSEKRRAAYVCAWLEAQIAAGHQLTVTLPELSLTCCERWLDLRLYWWTASPDRGRRVAIISSRTGRNPETLSTWLRHLRLTCAASLQAGDRLIHLPGTTTAEFCERCCELFELAPLRVHLPDRTHPMEDRPDSRRWLEHLMQLTSGEATALPDLIVSPELCSGTLPGDAGELRRIGADRDRLTLLLASQVRVLHLRPDGSLPKLLAARLQEDEFPAGSVWLLHGDRLCAPAEAEPLESLGAVAWYLSASADECVSAGDSTAEPADDEPTAQPSTAAISSGGPSLPEPLIEQRLAARRQVLREISSKATEWLSHCTRAPRGEWPDESRTDFLDKLLLSDEASGRTALTALLRIVSSQRLLASRQGIRGGFRMISFTAVPVMELSERRIWRTHRGRRDFEPFGLCFRRAALEHFGVRPVHYGDDELWMQLADADRPWFQLQYSTVGTAAIDWSIEREWRIEGDLDLSLFGPADLFLFCDSRESAASLESISRWPVLTPEDWSGNCAPEC